MLSVLIPTYNFDVCPLVHKLVKQLDYTGAEYEIIVLDDASTGMLSCDLNTLPRVHFEKLKENTGRSRIRNTLAKKARYPWLLFLDADTLPVHEEYIQNYLEIIKTHPAYDVFFGGIRYRPEDYRPDNSLRYNYGIRRESHNAHKREKQPYTSLLMSNTLMRKSVFDKISFNEKIKLYGHEDAVFSFDLHHAGFSLKHIDNPVYHTGLEENKVFLNKSKTAVRNLWLLYKQKLISPKINKLLRYYLFLEKAGLTSIPAALYEKKQARWERKLTGEKASMKFFDLFRLTYLCYVARENPKP